MLAVRALQWPTLARTFLLFNSGTFTSQQALCER